MARKPRTPSSPQRSLIADVPPAPSVPGTTGRFIVLFKEGKAESAVKSLTKRAGLAIASATDFVAGAAPHITADSDGLVFPALDVAVLETPPEQVHAVQAAAESDILAIEPERIVHLLAEGPIGTQPPEPPTAPGSGTPSLDYLRGYRDAVNHLGDKLLGNVSEMAAAGLAPAASEVDNTWGLQATKVTGSSLTGKGIRIAVLDTGLDLGHPDFTGRAVTAQSFLAGQAAQDGNGHGTHCIGTACGPRQPGALPRYGIAYEAEIFAGKVLSDQGIGGDSSILAGIQWAIDNKCQIVSMSLGALVAPGQAYSQIFEQVANRALAAGTVLIAAAGNNSRRPQMVSPVTHPANCPSIMAVGAVDRNMLVAWFSCGGINPQGGQVDVAGPGVDIRSSVPRAALYGLKNGTSMATPHVAGIAALWAQSDKSYRGRALLSVLTQSARRLPLLASDVGSGLVQAP